jgi:hypothetical protein
MSGLVRERGYGSWFHGIFYFTQIILDKPLNRNIIPGIIAPSASYSESTSNRAFNLLRHKMRRWGYQKLILLNL